MAKTLAELDQLRPVDPVALAEATEVLLKRERAWQLRELRTHADLTQAELANEMHVRQNRVSQIESAGVERTRLDTLRKYAQALGGELKVEIKIGEQSYAVV
jgi:predicted transcriptional regulator